MKTEEWTTKW